MSETVYIACKGYIDSATITESEFRRKFPQYRICVTRNSRGEKCLCGNSDEVGIEKDKALENLHKILHHVSPAESQPVICEMIGNHIQVGFMGDKYLIDVVDLNPMLWRLPMVESPRDNATKLEICLSLLREYHDDEPI